MAIGYNAAAAVPPLQNRAGVKAGRISGLAVTNERDETVPTVTSSPAFISIPTHDADGNGTADTYGEGAEIRVQLVYSEAVTVDTSRGRLRLEMRFSGTVRNTTSQTVRDVRVEIHLFTGSNSGRLRESI